MREVTVETVGKGTRTIKVGIDWSKIKVKKEKQYITDIICSPRILARPASDDCRKYTDIKCWKTPKKGEPKPKRCWQRHPGRQPSRRRNRWGRVRRYNYPSLKILNEMGRCIYPDIGGW